MRNIDEHFDESGGWSEAKLKAKYEGIHTNQITFSGKEIWIGGDDGIPLSRIRAWAVRAWSAFSKALTEAGAELPDDLSTSMVEDDDDLPWPERRIRFSWQIPLAEEENWPTKPLPVAVSDLIAKRFLALRERDSKD